MDCIMVTSPSYDLGSFKIDDLARNDFGVDKPITNEQDVSQIAQIAQKAPKITATPDRIDQLDEDEESESESESESEEQIEPRMNSVEELREGIIKTCKNKSNEYTILLVGETGSGKTTLLSLFANVLLGHSPKEYVIVHDKNNETGGAKFQSQTNSAKVYEFISKNDVKVRILDTPGLADTRGLVQDELHKASIARAIEENISTVNAVIVLANGTVERLGIATDYALSALSSIFPRTLADNIGLLFTNVASPLSWNFDQESLPDVLQDVTNNQFLLDNPLAQWKKLVQIRAQRKPGKRVLAELENAVNESYRKALRELALLFDWLDTLEPQPTKDIMSLYEKSQQIERNIANALASTSQLADKKSRLTRIKQSADGSKLTMKQFENYKSVITKKVWEQVDTGPHNTLCGYPHCYSNCHVSCSLTFSMDSSVLNRCLAMHLFSCRQCGHSYKDHRHYHSLWENRDHTQVVVDEGAEQKYNEAMQENNENEKIIVDLDKDIADLDERMEETLMLLGRLTESYASLSLSGSFAGQVKKAVRLLEVNLEAMRYNNADLRSIELVEKSLGHMKEKLKMVEQVDVKARNNVMRMIKGLKKKAEDFING